MLNSAPLILEEIPIEEQNKLIDRVAQMVVKRGLTAPAIILLEMSKPISFIGSQVMIALSPFVQAIFSSVDYQKFALVMEKEKNLELLIRRIEKLDLERRVDKKVKNDKNRNQ